MAFPSPKAPIVDTALPAAGLSLLWLYFRAHQLSFLTATLDRDIASSQVAYTTFAVSFAALAMLVAFMGPSLSTFMRSHSSRVAAGALGSIGLISEVLLWAPLPVEAQATALCAGSVLGAVFFVLATLCYGMLLAAKPPRDAAIIAFTSFGLCFLSNLVYLLPSAAQATICILYPLVSVCGMVPLYHAGQTDPAPGHPSTMTGLSPIRTLASAGFPIALMILLALFCLAGHIARGITDPWFSYGGPTWRSLVMSSVNIGAVAISVTLLARGFDVRRVLFWNWTLFMLMFLVGLLALAIGPAAVQPFASDLVTTARVCFTLLMFLFAVLSLPTMPFGATRLMGLLLLVPEAASGLVRFIGVPAFLGQAIAGSSTVVSYVAIGIVSVLLVAIIVLLNAMLMQQARPSLPGDGPSSPSSGPASKDVPGAEPSDGVAGALVASGMGARPSGLSHDEALEHLATRYGLTSREHACVRIFSHGYSLEKTADTMCVSINTVRTHLKNAYVKLGVHSRQELMDAIDAQRDQGEAPSR